MAGFDADPVFQWPQVTNCRQACDQARFPVETHGKISILNIAAGDCRKHVICKRHGVLFVDNMSKRTLWTLLQQCLSDIRFDTEKTGQDITHIIRIRNLIVFNIQYVRI